MVFGLFLVHDRHRLPYHHPYLNLLQILSSVSLLVVTACNNPAAFSAIFDIMAVPHMAGVVAMLQLVEVVVYVALPLSIVLWKVWEKVKLRSTFPKLRKEF